MIKDVRLYVCDFCGKDQHQVSHIIAGPRPAAICNECVDGCVEIIADSRKAREAKEWGGEAK